jgi:hypothetical protein
MDNVPHPSSAGDALLPDAIRRRLTLAAPEDNDAIELSLRFAYREPAAALADRALTREALIRAFPVASTEEMRP